MATIFSKIVQGDIPCHKIAETNDFLAFLDINPLRKGHTLVIPKREVDYIFDLEDSEIAGLHVFAKKVAIAVKSAFPCERIGTAVIGLEVPHAHLHLVPINKTKDIDFTQAKMKISKEELSEIASSIRSFYTQT